MATWWNLTFEGEPTEADFARVAEMTAQGFTSGQLVNEPGAEDEEGPATGVWAVPGSADNQPMQPTGHHRALAQRILRDAGDWHPDRRALEDEQ